MRRTLTGGAHGCGAEEGVHVSGEERRRASQRVLDGYRAATLEFQRWNTTVRLWSAEATRIRFAEQRNHYFASLIRVPKLSRPLWHCFPKIGRNSGSRPCCRAAQKAHLSHISTPSHATPGQHMAEAKRSESLFSSQSRGTSYSFVLHCDQSRFVHAGRVPPVVRAEVLLHPQPLGTLVHRIWFVAVRRD
jgi:hypothetical protein